MPELVRQDRGNANKGASRACYRRRMSWRYDVVGFLGGDFGLAVAARNTIRALEATGRMEKKIGIEVPAGLGGRLKIVATAGGSIAEGSRSRGEPPESRQVSLFQMNPIEIAWYTAQWRKAVSPAARKICVPFWELPLVPRTWEPMLGAMDAVLAPTRYVQAACAAVIPGDRVLHYPQAVFLPGGVEPDRAAWGVEGARTVFVVSFDPGSDIERKNPWAALEAFRNAFPRDPDVALIVKSKPWSNVPQFVAQSEELRARVGSDRRVKIVDRSLGYAEVLSLYASCDVMLSLHRSEGLGLHLMEAMSLGKVVVATNWSGNTDFMTRDDSVPVGYRLIAVKTGHGTYRSEVGRPGQEWAEADLREAAEAMRALHENPARRGSLGSAAAAAMERRRAAMLSGEAFGALEERLATDGGPAGGLSAATRRTVQAARRDMLRAGMRRATRLLRRS
jgi:glycosyltransferase involved in cell wall biosynthesis